MSLSIFGSNEIAVRLPSFLLSILIILILGKLVKKYGTPFYIPAFILVTTPEFLIHMGVISTDVVLTFSITLTMISFWKSMENDKKTFWNYLFFVGLGLGLLSKGPIAIILTGPPIFIWCLLDKKRWQPLFKKLPWVIGIFIAAAIGLPWYYLVEQKSPGFFDYFIIGEHFKRFIDSSWKGDLYGFAKSQPIGMIWLFLLGFAFPWIEILLFGLWKKRKNILKDKYVVFLLLWLFWTPLFFTMSRNALHTYILPSIIPLTLILATWWKDYKESNLLKLSLIFPALVVITFIAILFSGKFKAFMNTDKYLIQDNKICDINDCSPIYYWSQNTYSSEFYSKGKVKIIKDIQTLDSLIIHQKTMIIGILKKQEKEIPEFYKKQLTLIDSNRKTSFYLYKK
jgi:4-amino-4-deoxy-L-arabinose transferase-like glycosyltransferase